MLKRQEGAVVIERTAEINGVEYDPRLFDDGEVEEFLELALRNHTDPRPYDRFERMLRLAEDRRAAEEWPVFRRIGQVLSNRKYDKAREMLESIGLGPGDPDYDDLERRVQELEGIRLDAIARKEELIEQRLRDRVEQERRRNRRIVLLAREVAKEREIQAESIRGEAEDNVLIDTTTGRWVPASEPHGVSFVLRPHAVTWANHIEGKEHADRDRRLLAALLTADRRAERRRGETPTRPPVRRPRRY